MTLNDTGWVLFKIAGGQPMAWQIGPLRKTLRAIFPKASDDEVEKKIVRYFLPDDQM